MGSPLTVLPVMSGPGNAPFTTEALIDAFSAYTYMAMQKAKRTSE